MEQVGLAIQFLLGLPAIAGLAMAIIGFGVGWGVPAAITLQRGSMQWLSWKMTIVATVFALLGVAGIISLGVI